MLLPFRPQTDSHDEILKTSSLTLQLDIGKFLNGYNTANWAKAPKHWDWMDTMVRIQPLSDLLSGPQQPSQMLPVLTFISQHSSTHTRLSSISLYYHRMENAPYTTKDSTRRMSSASRREHTPCPHRLTVCEHIANPRWTQPRPSGAPRGPGCPVLSDNRPLRSPRAEQCQAANPPEASYGPVHGCQGPEDPQLEPR